MSKKTTAKVPLVSIIIANFNGMIYLDTCLKSVLASTHRNFELLIIDDGSKDKSLEIIRKFQSKDKRISLLINEKNIGAAASRNKALQIAKGKILVFLDNDTEVDNNWLMELMKPLMKNKEVGATQALLLDYKKRNLIQMGGGELVPYTTWLLPFYQWVEYKENKKRILEREIVATSAALAVKREAFMKINGFDEKEAVYSEDIDFSWRLWIAGYKVRLASKAIVYHYTKNLKERIPMGASNYIIYFHLAKNSFRSMLKNYETINVFRFFLVSIFINLFRASAVLMVRRDFSALVGTIAALGWNMLNLQDTLNFRRIAQKKRRLPDYKLLDLIFTKENLFKIYNNYFKQTKLLW